MAAIGMGIIFLGYAGGLYGYCLFKGYNVTPKQLFSPSWPPGGDNGASGRAAEAAGRGAVDTAQLAVKKAGK